MMPFMPYSYLSMLSRSREYDKPGYTLDPIRPDYQEPKPSFGSRMSNFFLPTRFGGVDVDEESARQARGNSLIALGSGLLEGASTGNLVGGLSKGVQGFAGTMRGTLDEERKIRLQMEEAQRQRDAEIRAQEAHTLNQSRGTEELEELRLQRQRTIEKYGSTENAARGMITEMREVAAKAPGDKMIQGILAIAEKNYRGQYSDVDKLMELHKVMVQESAEEQEAEQTRILKGLEQEHLQSLPSELADDARSNRGLDIQQGYLDNARERTTSGGLTKYQMITDLEQELNTQTKDELNDYGGAVQITAGQRKLSRERALPGAMETLKARYRAMGIELPEGVLESIGASLISPEATPAPPAIVAPPPTVSEVEGKMGRPLTSAERQDAMELIQANKPLDQIVAFLRAGG